MEKTFFEQIAWSSGSQIMGVDEVGRGCLMGPLVASACILKSCTLGHLNCDVLNYALLKDSKILSQKELTQAYEWLLEHSIFGIGIVSARLIDQINIYQATQIAMSRAIYQLMAIHEVSVSKILIDAMPLIIPGNHVESFIHGEQRSVSIAAASIIAKVTRDTLLQRLDKIFPNYNLSEHKGYGTKKHYQALEKYAPTILHRKSFLKDELLHQDQPEAQISIF